MWALPFRCVGRNRDAPIFAGIELVALVALCEVLQFDAFVCGEMARHGVAAAYGFEPCSEVPFLVWAIARRCFNSKGLLFKSSAAQKLGHSMPL